MEDEEKPIPTRADLQATDASVAETTPSVSRQRELISKRYPDRQFETEEDVQNALLDDYEESVSKLQDVELSNKRVYELIEANPSLADVIIEMDKGTPFEVALAQCIDLEALIPQNGEPNYELYQQAVEDRKKRSVEIATKRKSLEENQQQSKVDADEFFAQMGMDETEQTSFVDFVDNFIGDLFAGKVAKDTLKKMYQAFKYEEHIEQASEQGKIDGLNTTIETKRKVNSATDGLPSAGGGVEGVAPTKRERKIFEIE